MRMLNSSDELIVSIVATSFSLQQLRKVEDLPPEIREKPRTFSKSALHEKFDGD